MKLNKTINDIIDSGEMIGANRPSGRVTIEPDWKLNSTVPTYGGTIRGPYRYFQRAANDQVEVEIPNIKSIQWERGLSQNIATCNITIYNQNHDINGATPEILSQLGKPGYFWPQRGTSPESQALWNQYPAQGARLKNGNTNPSFDWTNVIVPNGLVRTYEGYGGQSLSIQGALDAHNLEPTGVWLIDRITAGTDGMLTLTCRDVGRLLLEQLVFPPLVPPAIYPLSYVPPGRSAFDSPWGASPQTGVSPASWGEVRMKYHQSATDILAGSPGANVAIDGHRGADTVDGRFSTYALSPAVSDPSGSNAYFWWEYHFDYGFGYGAQKISGVQFQPWAGGYTAYISVYTPQNGWIGTNVVPGGYDPIPYVVSVPVPLAVPDTYEGDIHVQLPNDVDAQYVRITLGPSMYYSGISDNSGNVYRCGIRDAVAWRVGEKTTAYSAATNSDPWTFSMTSHPTRGYWVVDSSGNVYGFGDAADNDSTAYGPVPLSNYNGGILTPNFASSMASHPNGQGYWVLDKLGHVYAYPSSLYHGQYTVPGDPGYSKFGLGGLQANGIAPTHTGNGYWVIYSDGTVRGFGDASPNYVSLPYTNVTNFMITAGPSYTDLRPANNPLGFERWTVGPQAYAWSKRGTGIAAHPTQMGFWATDGSGQIFGYGACQFLGQLENRIYNSGSGDVFKLDPLDWPHSIESTRTGNGYWIAFASGHIAAFGDAIKQGPTYIYENNPSTDIVIPDDKINDWSFFRSLVWDLARDPDGEGFWVLTAAGDVKRYNAEEWGQPGWYGKTGYRWHDGNFSDWADIVKDMLAWAGFTIYDPAQNALTPQVKARPPLYAKIENTGVQTDTKITGEKWDKRTTIDCINELKELTGYNFYIDQEGRAVFQSPNWWKSGNFDDDGQPIYVTYNLSGNWTRVASTAPGAEPYIPLVTEAKHLMAYSSTLDGENLRSEIIIGTDLPDPKDPSRTKFTRYVPPISTAEIRPGVPALRNIVRTALWVDDLFENAEEQKLMAELIGLQIWFGQRTGSMNIAGNPTIGIDDQVQIIERNTSETYTHYVRGVSSSLDLDTGEYTMSITTNWLGDADNWVITNQNIYNPLSHVGVSERVDRWQRAMDLGLGFQGNGSLPLQLVGGFV